MKNYYSKSLNANRLQKCYEIAPKRIKQLLEAEINFVLEKISRNTIVLDLGCGYGRVSTRISSKANKVVGIDISKDNIKLAKKMVNNHKNCEFYVMNATDLKFGNDVFDLVICIQNGISAFKVSPEKLLKEAIRVTKKGGIILFSSYSEKIWKDRLEWFEIQVNHGLIGEIDYNSTKNGIIVCKDGFKATTYSRNDFIELASNFNVSKQVYEIDNSSIFCKMVVN
jgi:2-polyprenyl-6-hydroxyphenyl methylase/3-demethylubiquinone-9 3-methyltransferase